MTRGFLRCCIVAAALTLLAIVALAADPTDALVEAAQRGDVMKLLIIALVAETAVIGWLVRAILQQNLQGATSLANVSAKLGELIDELRARLCIGEKSAASGTKKYSIR